MRFGGRSMMTFDLDFERPLADLDKRIQSLQRKASRLKSDDRARLKDYQSELDLRLREITAH